MRDPLLGQQLGAYVIEERMGAGAFGTVYAGRHVHLGQLGAVKVLHRQLAARGHMRARFLEEARAAAALSHPHIVRTYDYGVQGDVQYIVMDLIRSRTLSQWAAEGALAQPQLVRWLSGVAQALDFAHSKGVVHRDLKPANVLIREADDEALLTDFGIAHVLSQGDIEVTSAVEGTFAYMSPEQCRGEEPQRSSDVYSLGVMLFELACGQPPFGHGPQALHRHVADAPPSVRTINPYLPPALDAVLSQSLDKQPGARQASASALVYDFCAALGFDSGLEAQGTHADAAERRRRRVQRRKLLRSIGAAVVAVLLLIVTGLIVTFRTSPAAVWSGALSALRGNPSGQARPASQALPVQMEGVVGQPIRMEGLAVTVVQANLDYQPHTQLIPIAPGNRFVIVEILYESEPGSNIPIVYDKGSWLVQDDAGYQYQPYALTDAGPLLSYGTIRSGQKARGFIAYAVPRSAHGLALLGNLEGHRLTVPLG